MIVRVSMIVMVMTAPRSVHMTGVIMIMLGLLGQIAFEQAVGFIALNQANAFDILVDNRFASAINSFNHPRDRGGDDKRAASSQQNHTETGNAKQIKALTERHTRAGENDRVNDRCR